MLEHVHQAITNVWGRDIRDDYEQKRLLREDTLKAAFYFHLRNELSDPFLEENHLRIFTEYPVNKQQIADLVVVRMKENADPDLHLSENVEQVIAVVEMKYKWSASDTAFLYDVDKVVTYIDPASPCLYYLAFIHEAWYMEPFESWLAPEQKEKAKGRLTELLAYQEEHSGPLIWKVHEHQVEQVLARL